MAGYDMEQDGEREVEMWIGLGWSFMLMKCVARLGWGMKEGGYHRPR